MTYFLLYGCSFVVGVSLLFAFIKFTVSSIKNEGKLEKKEKELNEKINKLANDHNSLHKLQSELNAREVHRQNNSK